jgi:hypothetical protein
MVPLRSAATRLGSPALISDCAPMMDRVRPAQLTITVVAGSGASCLTRATSSAPGTLVAVGILMVVYSSNRRASTTTAAGGAPSPGAPAGSGAPSLPGALRSSAATSGAGSRGVPVSSATSSPNALLGALTSLNSSPPAAVQPSIPPASRPTSRKPSWRSRAAAASASGSLPSLVPYEPSP